MCFGTDGFLLRIDVVGLHPERILAQGRNTCHWHLASIMGFVGRFFFDILLSHCLIVECNLSVNFSTLL